MSDDICTEGQDKLVRFFNILTLIALAVGLAAVLGGEVNSSRSLHFIGTTCISR